MPRTERLAIIDKLQKARKTNIICFLTSDRPKANYQIQKDVLPLFYEHLIHFKKHEKLDVFIFTDGGDTLAGFGIGRLIREFFPWYGALVPLKCHSAGTLFALGANQIVMNRAGTLSPIDPSLVRPLNPAVEMPTGERLLVPVSVESVVGFRDLVKQEWGINGEEWLSAAFRVLSERVHPLALGDVTRARQQIELLARKLLQSHRSDETNIERIITILTKELGSHDYLISRSEARELLGPQVADEDSKTEKLLWALYQDFATEMRLGQEYNVNLEIHEGKAEGKTMPIDSAQKIAIVESEGFTHCCERVTRLSEAQMQTPVGLQTVIGQELVRSGWRRYT
jgi:hypothetical protein